MGMPRRKIILVVEQGDARLLGRLAKALAEALNESTEYWYPGEEKEPLTIQVEDPDNGKIVMYNAWLPRSMYELYRGLVEKFLDVAWELSQAPID
jgi:hypothetical protein